MNSSFHSWGVFAIGGLLFYVISRLARREKRASYYEGFGVWLNPPGWARVAFGGIRGRVRWDVLTWELMSLTSFVFGAVGWVLQPPSRSMLFAALGLPIMGSVLLMGVVLTVVLIGRKSG